jgi:uncharacterized delta-60 repeat protein
MAKGKPVPAAYLLSPEEAIFMKAQQASNLRQTISRLCLCTATLLLMAGLPAVVRAAPGDLDLSFGNGGIVVTPITDAANLYEEPNSILVQPDGKIVICGRTNYSDDETGYPVSFFLARYNPSGTLDTTFGTNGKVVAPVSGGSGGVHGGQSMALQPDGKIITVGYGFGGGSSSAAVFRYNPDGTLDASFGTGGTVFTSGVNSASDVAVQPDGKIVVSGSAYVFGQDANFAVVRYNPDGSLDKSFGAGGIAVTPVRDGDAADLSSAVALQPDGKIVVVGTSLILGREYDFALARYNPDGSLDSGFGTGGKIIHSFISGTDIAHDVALQPDGKIVVAGGGLGIDGTTAVVRYNADGSIDTGFAADGVFRTEGGFFVGHGIALQPDAKIVAFGAGYLTDRIGFAVARLNPNGSPDAGFGTNGRLITPIGTDGGSAALDGALQSDGKILAFGVTRRSDSDDIAIIRYLGASASPNPIDDSQFFVRQQYLDFLSREPEPSGMQAWLGVLNGCPNPFNTDPNSPSAACDRIAVSAAFFQSPEFRLKGFYAFTSYRVAFNRLPEYSEIIADMQGLSGATPAELYQRRTQFPVGFTGRAEFKAFYDSLSDAAFVAALLDRYGLQQITTPDPADPEGGAKVLLARADLIARLGAQSLTRAQVLRAAVESDEVGAAEYDRAFVAMQYYGYLRRTPEQSGYEAWLRVISQDPQNVRVMVNGFINSTEYALRFRRP